MIVGSHSVNGVAELHTKLLKAKELKDFYEMYMGRFNNKTNGITPRRWLLASNRGLAGLITDRIGSGWVKNLDDIRKIEPLAEDEEFRQQFRAVKQANKDHLAEVARELTGYAVDPNSIFDVQIKRIHEYKRQLLNILHVAYCWMYLKQNPGSDMHPRTFLFGGKAAPGYTRAKNIIRLICHVADMINKDPSTNKLIKVIFLPNYRVSLAEKIFPASDVSEQISTAGFEASGTGNMKFALNGALTVGTLDGANIEIMEEVGKENIFIFGLTTDEVAALRPTYDPRQYYEKDPLLKETIDLIREGFFSPEHPDMFHPLVDSLLSRDNFMVLADFEAYLDIQKEVDKAYRDTDEWTKKAIINVARIGKFSSDRTILEYNRDIWRADPLIITRDEPPKPTK